MPIRTYICQSDHEFERINDTLTVKCPKCGKRAKAKEWEVSARRNPDHGIQTKMESSHG